MANYLQPGLIAASMFIVVSLTKWRRSVRAGGLRATPRESAVEVAKALGGAALILGCLLVLGHLTRETR